MLAKTNKGFHGSIKTVQRTGASRFAQRQIQRHRRLAPVADHCVKRHRQHQHMLTPEQFSLRWRSEVVAKDSIPEDVKLLTAPAQQLASVRLPESTRRFLVEADLTKGCAPFLGFEEVGKG